MLTFWHWHRYRSISMFIALIDLGFCGAFIAGVILLRFIGDADCGDASAPIGITLGDHSYSAGNSWSASYNSQCGMLQASWGLGIVEIILFFITAVLSWRIYSAVVYGAPVAGKVYTSRRSGSSSRAYV